MITINTKTLILFVIFAATLLYADKLEVTADTFSSKESEGKAYFNGHAIVKKDGSSINSDKIVVFFDTNKTIIKYEAEGNTTFVIKKDKMHFKGSCNKVAYSPILDTYTLNGNIVVHDVVKNRTLYGEDIIIDNNKSSFRVEGKKNHPAKIVFEMK